MDIGIFVAPQQVGATYLRILDLRDVEQLELIGGEVLPSVRR